MTTEFSPFIMASSLNQRRPVMEKDKRQELGLMRYGAISPVLNGLPDGYKTIREYFEELSTKGISHPDGNIRHYSPNTFQAWYTSYRRDGFKALEPAGRSDEGISRKIDDDIAERIRYLKNKYPRLPATMIHKSLIDEGIIKNGEISVSTVNRFIKRLDLKNKEEHDEMRRYERPHINEVWYGDSSVGLYIKTKDGKKHKVYIIALIDDASRFIVGANVFFNDTFVNLMAVLKSAISKYGNPNVLSFDNGSAYRNKQMELLAARIGTTLHYCRPYTPTQKSKIERWFRTCKDHWCAFLDYKEFDSLESVRLSFFEYVNSYNQTVHNSLKGLTPQERFFKEPEKIRRLSTEKIDRSFLLEIERHVSNDGVISIENVLYEVDYHFAGKTVTIRYTPDMKVFYVVAGDELLPIRALDKHDNAKAKRKVHLSGNGGED